MQGPKPIGRFFSGRAAGHVLVISPAMIAFWASPLWAIPSPDLVVNFAASAAQVLGLLTVIAGSFAFSGRRRARAQGRAGSNWRWPFRICLTALCLSIAANVFQYTQNLDDRNRRLQTNLWRSSTEAGKKVGDINLKTLSVSEQLKRPDAIRTEDLIQWLAEKRPLNLIDVREPEEVEMGKVPGCWHRRYPDLQANPDRLEVEGKQTVLLCESGNRSGELSEYFRGKGYKTLFVIGGYEKWVAEGRPLENAKERTSGEIRDIPDYPNKHVLLDTPEVQQLLEKENVLFVDVRYPGEFDQGHLPEAVNITLRKMQTAEMNAALTGLPRRPIVAACYDKRSSFYGLVLGLRLHRLGYDYRGRYTVPYEMAQRVEDKAWVAQWKEAQAGNTLFGLLTAPLKGSLEWLEGRTGSLVLAILCVVLALRLLFLPLTLKAERDQRLQAMLGPDVKELKVRLGDDPKRLSRAILALHRRHRLTLGRNVLGTVMQLILLTAFFTAVNTASANANQSFGWLPSLANPDPLYILPVLVGAAITVHLIWNATQRTPLRIGAHIACGLLLALVTLRLRAGVNIYLVANIGLLVIQSRFAGWLQRRSETKEPKRRLVESLEKSGMVVLKFAHHVPGTGNKAVRLSRMLEKGLPVPDGFVLTDRVLFRESRLEFSHGERRHLSKLWKGLQTRHAAVRSSGLNEDGCDKSYAGVFESVLNVSYEKLFGAIEEVHGSLRSHRVQAYSGSREERGGILIQKMVPAEYAGVLFTEHPAACGAALVELVEGLGDALVSGSATPRSYRFGRVSGLLLDATAPPIDLAPLLELGRAVEAAFGKPQDIEWAYSKGKFQVLQARDITTSSRSRKTRQGRREEERRRLLEVAEKSLSSESEANAPAADVRNARFGKEPIFVQNELSEVLPTPSPLSLSLMERLWAPGGSTDLAARALGLPYDVEENSPPLANSVFGALYVNVCEANRRARRSPGAIVSFRLARTAADLVTDLQEFLPGYLRDVRRREALDPSRLELTDLLDLLEEWLGGFVTQTYFEAEKINLAADFYLKAAKREVERRGLDPSICLANVPETVVHRALSILPGISVGHRTVEDFLEVFGHRSPADYELARPRYSETPDLVLEMASRSKETPLGSRELSPPEGPTGRMLLLGLERARQFQCLKEEAKHQALRELACIRKLLLELGARTRLGAGVFYLTLDEVQRLRDATFREAAAAIARQRQDDAEAFEGLMLPTQLSVSQLEALDLSEMAARPFVEPTAGMLRGVRVSGSKDVEGVVRVVTSSTDLSSFREGEILVARFTDPTWTPLFPRASGVITEVGGWLSHAAIVAREYGVTCVVGATGALSTLETGDWVQIRSDGSIHRGTRARRPAAAPITGISIQVALERQGEILQAIVEVASRTDAFLSLPEGILLEAGEDVTVKVSAGGELVRAQVVRREGNGGYKISFLTPPVGLIPTDSSAAQN